MINVETATVLLNASKEIYRLAKKGDKPIEKETGASRRAGDSAWRAVSQLIQVLEHAKESDLYWKLVEKADSSNKSDKEKNRLYTIAKREDAEFMSAKLTLEKTISEAVGVEKADPKGMTVKAGVEERRKIDIAAKARDVDKAAIAKALKKAKSAKETKELSVGYQKANDIFDAASRKALKEKKSVYDKFGLKV